MNAAMRIYQTHGDGEAGMSDSRRKLARLRLPADMSGMSVLDVGCNEGFFCAESVRRGAARVVGIDFDAPRLDFARERYGALGIDFRYQTWERLPEGPFDLVLWTSAMHYERNPKRVLEAMRSILRPSGVLVLECGVVESAGKEMVRVNRHSDTQLYPTTRLLTEDFLAGYAWRCVAGGEVTEGDPVPRQVFHCTPRLPNVLLIGGPSGTGKSFLAAQIGGTAGGKVYSVDHLLTRLATAAYASSDVDRVVQANYDPDDLSKAHLAMHAAGLDREWALVLAEFVTPDDSTVVFEGYLHPAVERELVAALAPRARVWGVTRREEKAMS